MTRADRAESFTATTNESGAFVFDVAGRVPRRFNGAAFVCAVGTLGYRTQGRDVQLALRTRASNRRPAVSIAPMVVAPYDLYLDPEREHYVAVVPTLHEIAPGETANIVLTVLSERSSTFTLRPSVRTSAGVDIPSDAFELEIVVPRRAGYFVLNDARRLAIPRAAIEAEDRDDWIESASYDPQAREPARFTARSDKDEAACLAFLSEEAPRILRRAGVAQTRAEILRGPADVMCRSDEE